MKKQALIAMSACLIICLLVVQKLHKLLYRLGAVAHAVLNLIAKLGECLVIAFRHKDRIIAKATISAPLAYDASIHLAMEEMLLPAKNESHTCAKACLPCLLTCHGAFSYHIRLYHAKAVEKHVYVGAVFIDAVIHTVQRCITSGIHSWLSAKGFHLQARVVGKTVEPIVFFHIHGFLQSVCLKGDSRLWYIHITANVFETLNLIHASQYGAYLFQLMNIIAGKYQCLHII